MVDKNFSGASLNETLSIQPCSSTCFKYNYDLRGYKDCNNNGIV
jgi:hypothetical protein